MAIGSKEKYTEAQERKAEHIEESYQAKGVSQEKSEEIAWATVNKQSGGGERSGSGVNKPQEDKETARKDSADNAAQSRQVKNSPNALEHQSIASLRAKARKKHISGRSTMNKTELIMALRQTR
jgi:hypothetical protein